MIAVDRKLMVSAQQKCLFFFFSRSKCFVSFFLFVKPHAHETVGAHDEEKSLSFFFKRCGGGKSVAWRILVGGGEKEEEKKSRSAAAGGGFLS